MPAHKIPADAPILIVDDEFLVLWSLQDALEQQGFCAIQTAANTRAALGLLNSQTFSFAFLDVNLGQEKSFDVARALQSQGVPFAFVTGYGRSGLDGQFEGAQVLSKPLDPRALRQTIEVAA